MDRSNLPGIPTVLNERHTIALASGMLMELDESTTTDATARLSYLSRRFRLSLFEMATVVIESRA